MSLQSPMMRMRQVEQRARPPQTLACGHVVAQACLEHAQALRHPDRAAVAIGQVDHAAAALVAGRARRLRQQHDDRAGRDSRSGNNRRCRPACPAGPRVPTCARVRFSARHSLLVAVGCDGSPALIEAEHRQRRNQHRGGEQKRRGALEERLHPQPEIKADAAVHPGDDQDREHQPDPVRRRRPRTR